MPNISFILVEPSLPENVGFAARAIKTTGFSDLRIVNSLAHTKDGAIWTAYGAKDILDNVKTFCSLSQALYDCDFAIATTARFRNKRKDYLTPKEIVELIKRKVNTIKNIALVFGCEESGLSNKDMNLCDVVSNIPLNTKFPSLNLSQAVMVYAYELSFLLKKNKNIKRKESNYISQHALLKEKIKKLLIELDYSLQNPIYQRILDRLSLLEEIDIKLAHSVVNKVLDKIKIKKEK